MVAIFILAERHKSKDTIGVYDAGDSYKLVRVRHLLATVIFQSMLLTRT